MESRLYQVISTLDWQTILNLYGVVKNTINAVDEKFCISEKFSGWKMHDYNLVTATSASALNTISSGMQIYRMASGVDNEHALRLVSELQKSAENSYYKAEMDFKKGELGVALVSINKAIHEFSQTATRLESHNFFFASLYSFKGIILFYQKKYNESIQSLEYSLEKNPAQPLVLNLMAFIHLYHGEEKDNHKCESLIRSYLESSLKYSERQIFAKFYLAKLDNNQSEMDESFSLLMEIFSHQVNVDIKSMEKMPEEAANLAASTLPAFMPYIATAWLDSNAAIAGMKSDARRLAEIAAIYGIVSQHYGKSALKECAVMILKSRINVFQKIIRIKEGARLFEDFDLEWRDAHSLIFDSNKHFFPYEHTGIDTALFKLFPSGTDTAMLRTSSLKNAMAQHILLLIELGRINFNGCHFRLAQKIHDLSIKAKKEEKREGEISQNTKSEMKDLCCSDEIINYYLDTYVEGKGWLPWLEVASHENGDLASLLHLACRARKINLHIYQQKDEDEKKGLRLISSIGDVSEKGRPADLHTLLEGGNLSLLHKLITPSSVYRRVMLRDSLSLLEKDPNMDPTKDLSGDILSKRRLASIPALVANQPASTALVCHRLKIFSEESKKANPSVSEKLKAEFKLIVAHTQYRAVDDFDLNTTLEKVITSEHKVYSECARVFRARLYFRYSAVSEEAAREADLLIASDGLLTTQQAKAFRLLLLAEYHLRGFYNQKYLFRPDKEGAHRYLLEYAKAAGIIEEASMLTIEDFRKHLNKVKACPVLSYCHGYAVSLLGALSITKLTSVEDYNAYRALCVDLEFYLAGEPSLEQRTREVMGIMQCGNRLFFPSDSTFINTSHFSYQYSKRLNELLVNSSLLLPFSAYINRALSWTDEKFSEKYESQRRHHHWILGFPYTTGEEIWFNLRDKINANSNSIFDLLLLAEEHAVFDVLVLETRKWISKKNLLPFSVTQINIENLEKTSWEAPIIINSLLYVLHKSGNVEIENYDLGKIYSTGEVMEVLNPKNNLQPRIKMS